jgi:histidyl-tRNA synthetase
LKRLTRVVLIAGVQLEQALQLPEFSLDAKQEGSLAATKLGTEALRELHLLGKNVHALDMRCRVIVDPWFSLGPNYEGMVFQGVLIEAAMPREAVMAGGRYDVLLFRN